MQLVLSLRQGGCQLAPSHVKRDLNTWADELTHPDPTGFNLAKRLRASGPLQSHTLMNWVFQELYPKTKPGTGATGSEIPESTGWFSPCSLSLFVFTTSWRHPWTRFPSGSLVASQLGSVAVHLNVTSFNSIKTTNLTKLQKSAAFAASS